MTLLTFGFARRQTCVLTALGLVFVSAFICTEVFATNSVSGENVGPYHNSYLLELPGPIKTTIHEDIDQDGLTDVITIFGDTNPRLPARNMAVFFQEQEGFKGQPDLLVIIPDDMVVIDFGEVNSDASGLELLLLSGQDLRWVSLTRPAQILEAPQQMQDTGEILFPVESSLWK